MEAWGSSYLAAQAAYLRYLGTAPSAEVIEAEGVYAVRTGAISNSENGVLSEGRARVSRDAAEKLIGWFHEWMVPASWLCAEGAGRPETAASLEAAGCQPECSAREMRATLRDLSLDAITMPADTRIEPVASERELDSWLEVASACGWFETDQGRQAMKHLFLGLGFASSAPLRLYLGSRDEAAVAMASAFYVGRTVLLTSVAVRPDVRGEGIGRALALTRLREARQRGCELAVLAPSPEGARLYGTLGFESRPQPPARCFYLPPVPEVPTPSLA